MPLVSLTNYRLYLHPEPEYGSHPGYRGPLHFCEYGIWTRGGCEWLMLMGPGSFSDDPGCGWEPVEVPTLIPWARIDSVAKMSS